MLRVFLMALTLFGSLSALAQSVQIDFTRLKKPVGFQPVPWGLRDMVATLPTPATQSVLAVLVHEDNQVEVYLLGEGDLMQTPIHTARFSDLAAYNAAVHDSLELQISKDDLATLRDQAQTISLNSSGVSFDPKQMSARVRDVISHNAELPQKYIPGSLTLKSIKLKSDGRVIVRVIGATHGADGTIDGQFSAKLSLANLDLFNQVASGMMLPIRRPEFKRQVLDFWKGSDGVSPLPYAQKTPEEVAQSTFKFPGRCELSFELK